MKKIDKLVFSSFIGPFILTLLVADFIILVVSLMNYLDEIMGKGLGAGVYLELFSYFSISSSPDAFPLAVLLSSIMTFGNLGEHSEITALKSSGISLVRTLYPIFLFSILLVGFTYYTNTNLVPKVNLKTYSLLWDIRTKKPALDIQEGVFYNGIPGYSIKVNEKIGEEQLKDIIIYNHNKSNGSGNKEVILADSGRMYSFMDQRYLAFELYDGVRYQENVKENYKDRQEGGQFVRERFSSNIMRFDLSSFEMGDTDEKLFGRSRLVQTRSQLIQGVDSMHRDIYQKKEQLFKAVTGTFSYHGLKNADVPRSISIPKAYYDSIRLARLNARPKPRRDSSALDTLVQEGVYAVAAAVRDKEKDSLIKNQIETKAKAKDGQLIMSKPIDETFVAKVNELSNGGASYGLRNFDKHYRVTMTAGLPTENITAFNWSENRARSARNLLTSRLTTLKGIERDQRKFLVTKNQQMARALACFIMFLIGAPIGAIIKKGGIGMPVVVSIIFFLVYYILNTMGDKWGKAGVVHPAMAVWISNLVLFPIGLFFLRQARNDARLFDPDFYVIFWQRVKGVFSKKKIEMS